MIGSKAVRKHNLALYRGPYAKLPLVDASDKWKCFYCGQEGGTTDHQPPLAAMDRLITSSMFFECVKVPCCHSCNALLGASPTITLSERMMLLKDALRKKYWSELRVQGQWTLNEILELGPSLRQMVLGSVRLGIDAEDRILYPGHKLRALVKVEYGLVRECEGCGYISDNDEDLCPFCGTGMPRH